ncbi:hypothetical protein C8R45DRAFT_1077095 [Mycena sanguinolenta]|nr:hypothetical protein C8R45DRAFT_1077095 [Mycena sanguinolenta]
MHVVSLNPVRLGMLPCLVWTRPKKGRAARGAPVEAQYANEAMKNPGWGGTTKRVGKVGGACCPQENTHLESDPKIVEAGTRTKNPVRTIILLPGQIYGIGRGLQKTTLWVRIFLDIVKDAGYCGTWGPGENSQSNIHVRDMARAVTTVLNAALEGKAGEGADDLYFTVSSAPLITYHDWSTMMGDILFEKGFAKERGAKPFPLEITELWGHYGWSLFGGNQRARPDRLSALGWMPKQSLLSSIHEMFPAMVEAALEDYAIKAKFAFR